jgi:hypothetical protein
MGTPARFTARSKARAKSRCEVNRSGPRLAYRIRMRWTTGACPPSGCGFLLIAVLLACSDLRLYPSTQQSAGMTDVDPKARIAGVFDRAAPAYEETGVEFLAPAGGPNTESR